MAEHTQSMPTIDAERARSGLRSRMAKPRDCPAMVRIYNKCNETVTGTCVRNPSNWDGFSMGSYSSKGVASTVIENEKQKLIGYVAYDTGSQECCASEIAATTVDGYKAILTFLAKRAVKLRREKVFFKLPAEDPFSRWARQFGLKNETHYDRNGEPMARVTNLDTCISSLLPELNRRLTASANSSTPSGFRIDTDMGAVCIKRSKHQLQVVPSAAGLPTVRVAQNNLTRLIMGFNSVSGLVATGALKAPKSLHPLLNVLFPLHTSNMLWSDRFQ